MKQKTLRTIQPAGATHFVGDGFNVSPYIPRSLWLHTDPFLILDYNAPWKVLPTKHARGVGVHPHKGFETITIAWQGEVSHADSSGGSGTIGAGDVQWMTAGKGILHKEFHSEAFSKNGGAFEMAQLWLNLPARFKNVGPGYQDIRHADIPSVFVAGDKGSVRIIAGELNGVKGPAKTFTPVHLFDARLSAGATWHVNVPEGHSLSVAVLSGNVLLNNEHQVRGGNIAVLNHSGSAITVESNNEAHLLVLGGEPLRENIMAQGPFVMNTRQELLDSFEEFDNGAFGQLV